MISSTLYRSSRYLLLAFFFSLPAFGYVFEDEEPAITDRVARISSIDGDVQIRRKDSEEWESAVLNLPIVEGDVISAGKASRFEIQLNSKNYVRVSENSIITLTTLQDKGIALSLQQGSALIRVNEIDRDREFFEIDAPRTTIALQRNGQYFIEAGSQSDEVRVAVYNDGEARVYSESSGFSLRSGRSARMFIGGANVGEWTIEDASRFDLAFFDWSEERDDLIARRLQNAHYDKYYDRDIYGADELNDYGDWTYDRSYGYVWRPATRSISYYDDWSPYRYGQWRWLPSYGWTWVNDEPWGWATYHHGRWVWTNGNWFWAPYSYYRDRRSWWRPALVVLGVYNNRVCWYPLPYQYAYYDYNRRHWLDRANRNPQGQGTVATNPTPTPVPGGTVTLEPRSRGHKVPFEVVPEKGVVAMSVEEFGKRRIGQRLESPTVAKEILSKVPNSGDSPPILPSFEEVKKRPDVGIVTAKKRPAIMPTTVRTGAATRTLDAPLDKQLEKTRIYGNRPPLGQPTGQTPGINPSEDGKVFVPRVGAVTRPTEKRDEGNSSAPIIIPPAPRETPRRTETPKYEPTPQRTESPKYEPPPRRTETPRYEPPQRRTETPRYEPPPQRTESPKYEPPPRSDPPKRSEPPPQKSEPSKPSAPSGKKDGR